MAKRCPLGEFEPVTWAVGYLDRLAVLRAPGTKGRCSFIQVSHAVDQDGGSSVQMFCQDQSWPTFREPHLAHDGAHRSDLGDQPGAQDVDEERQNRAEISCREVDEIKRQEHRVARSRARQARASQLRHAIVALFRASSSSAVRRKDSACLRSRPPVSSAVLSPRDGQDGLVFDQPPQRNLTRRLRIPFTDFTKDSDHGLERIQVPAVVAGQNASEEAAGAILQLEYLPMNIPPASGEYAMSVIPSSRQASSTPSVSG